MPIAYNFEFFLTVVVLITGIGALIDLLFFAKKRKQANKDRPKIVAFFYGYFPVFFLVLLIRSFVFQPYRVVSGSLEPTVLVGDLLFVNQYAYGLHLPVLHNRIISTGSPKRGQIVLFYSPLNPTQVWVKRLVGLPGDKLEYKNKVLTINGKVQKQKVVGTGFDVEPHQASVLMQKRIENLDGVKHYIYVSPNYDESGDFTITVPKGTYFMMGDNRDDSDDSRMWGPLPTKYLIGKAEFIAFSWNTQNQSARWNRIGNGFVVKK